MIDGVGKAGAGRVDLGQAAGAGAARPVKAPERKEEARVAAQTPAGEMAAAGAPVDMDKVAAIRAAIAEGRYPVDPDKIAAKMIELDLGHRL